MVPAFVDRMHALALSALQALKVTPCFPFYDVSVELLVYPLLSLSSIFLAAAL